MKKIILLLSVASLVFSCSSDDDGESPVVDCVICESMGEDVITCDNGNGTVTVEQEGGESEVIDLPEGMTFEEFSVCPDVGIDDSDLIGAWVFVSDSAEGELIDVDPCELMNTLTYTADMATRVFFTSVEGECKEDGGDVFTYTVDGDTITSVNEEGDIFVETYSVDGTTLTLTIEEDDSEDDNGELTTFVEVFEKQ